MRLAVLGATGSVGQSTLDVVRRHPDKYQIEALTAHRNITLLSEQIKEFKPAKVVVVDDAAAVDLRCELQQTSNSQVKVLSGTQALIDIAADTNSDAVMAAIVGAAGLESTLAAVGSGKRTMIANKEPLVMTGDLFMQLARSSGAQILPIDSEHNAIFQCMPSSGTSSGDTASHQDMGVTKIHLTASGGPFRGKRWNSLNDITPAQACAHPNWSMGRKISVDSATMMNKGLELIEAKALFGVNVGQIEILIHPQSIIHSMVEYVDGSFLAQLGAPDMKIPIAHALAWPERINSGSASLDLAAIAKLDFEKPDLDNIPCLKLAIEAAHVGGAAPTVLNAANEIAVEAFLNEQIKFTSIPKVIEGALEQFSTSDAQTLEEVLNIDNEVRSACVSALSSFA
ncbi:MAG: 1-deoxy-D-xylulose-5-phosphate reductoisomerase [Pseudomonadota bacterium]